MELFVRMVNYAMRHHALAGLCITTGLLVVPTRTFSWYQS